MGFHVVFMFEGHGTADLLGYRFYMQEGYMYGGGCNLNSSYFASHLIFSSFLTV